MVNTELWEKTKVGGETLIFDMLERYQKGNKNIAMAITSSLLSKIILECKGNKTKENYAEMHITFPYCNRVNQQMVLIKTEDPNVYLVSELIFDAFNIKNDWKNESQKVVLFDIQ